MGKPGYKKPGKVTDLPRGKHLCLFPTLSRLVLAPLVCKFERVGTQRVSALCSSLRPHLPFPNSTSSRLVPDGIRFHRGRILGTSGCRASMERLTLAGECEFYVRVSIFIRKGERTEFQRSSPPPTLGSFSFRARRNDTLPGLGIFGRDLPLGKGGR